MNRGVFSCITSLAPQDFGSSSCWALGFCVGLFFHISQWRLGLVCCCDVEESGTEIYSAWDTNTSIDLDEYTVSGFCSSILCRVEEKHFSFENWKRRDCAGIYIFQQELLLLRIFLRACPQSSGGGTKIRDRTAFQWTLYLNQIPRLRRSATFFQILWRPVCYPTDGSSPSSHEVWQEPGREISQTLRTSHEDPERFGRVAPEQFHFGRIDTTRVLNIPPLALRTFFFTTQELG